MRRIFFACLLFSFISMMRLLGLEVSLAVLDSEEYFPVQGAQIKISPFPPKVTNAWGKVDFDGLPKGPSLVEINHPQYKEFKKVYFFIKNWQQIVVYLERDYQSVGEKNIIINVSDSDLGNLPRLLFDAGLGNFISQVGEPISILRILAEASQNKFLKNILNIRVLEKQTEEKVLSPLEPLSLINKMENIGKSVVLEKQDDLEYILGQERVPAQEPNLKFMIAPPHKKRTQLPPSRILTVVVVDDKGIPVGGKKVNLYSQGNKLLSSKVTDTFGRVIFYELPKTTVKVEVDTKSKEIYLAKTYNFCDFRVKTFSQEKQESLQAFSNRAQKLMAQQKKEKEKQKNKWEEVKKEKVEDIKTDQEDTKEDTKIIKINNMKFRW